MEKVSSEQARPPTPNLDKRNVVQDQSRPIGEFLEWLQYSGYCIGRTLYHQVSAYVQAHWAEHPNGSPHGWPKIECALCNRDYGVECFGKDEDCPQRDEGWHEPHLNYATETIEDLLHAYFEIDQAACATEQDALLAFLRSL